MRRSGSHPMMANEGTPRARRRARGSRTRLGGFACALLLLLALPGAARSEVIGLSDFGALVEIDASETGGLTEIDWGFESGLQVTQLLFLSGVEVEPMDLELEDVQVTDTNSFFDESPDTAVLTYVRSDLNIGMQISLLLRGVPEGPEISDLVETILMWNGTEDTVYFNQIVMTSLWDDPEGDVFVYPTEPGNTNLVRVVDGLAVFEEVVTPAAEFEFFEEFADNAFLMRWEIEPGEFLLVSKDKSLNLVPEPGTAALSGLGLIGLAILGRRRALEG